MKPTIIGDCTLYEADSTDMLAEKLFKIDLLFLDPPFELWGSFNIPSYKTAIAFCSPTSRLNVENFLGKPRCELVWHFADGRWVSKNLPRITHDYIYIYGATKAASVGELQETKAQKKGKSSIGKDCLGSRTYMPKRQKHLNSVQIFPRNMSGPLGAWGKPEKLINRLIDWVDSDNIYDPFMGSGTSGVVAVNLGKKFIGVEINPKYFDIACSRIEKAYEQPNFFVTQAKESEQTMMIFNNETPQV